VTTLPPITPAYAPQPTGTPWPTTEWPEGWASNSDELNELIDSAINDPDLGDTRTVLVIKHGRIIAERYHGEIPYFDRPAELVGVDTTQISWSMAKSMLAHLVGTLVDEGKLDPAAPASVREWSDPSDPRHAITLANLLAMRDGLNFSEEYDVESGSDVIRMLFAEGAEDMAHFTASKALAHAPGTFWNYSSGTTNIIARIVADVVGYGAAYEQFITERLFGPLGMTSAIPKFDATGNFIASSYVYATARDFAKFGLLYLRGGEWDGQRLVSTSWVDTAQVPLSIDEEAGTFYSWQWWVTGDRYGSYWANGFEGQSITVVPALDAVIVRLGRTDADGYPALRTWRSSLIEAVARTTVS
jgi:CubicO group peptidase (beta-lactamase class C family)